MWYGYYTPSIYLLRSARTYVSHLEVLSRLCHLSRATLEVISFTSGADQICSRLLLKALPCDINTWHLGLPEDNTWPLGQPEIDTCPTCIGPTGGHSPYKYPQGIYIQGNQDPFDSIIISDHLSLYLYQLGYPTRVQIYSFTYIYLSPLTSDSRADRGRPCHTPPNTSFFFVFQVHVLGSRLLTLQINSGSVTA